MLRYFNNWSLELQEKSDYGYPVEYLKLKRRDTPQVSIVNVDNTGAVLELDPITPFSSFIFGCKLPDRLSGDYIISNWNGTSFAYIKTGGSIFTDAATTTGSSAISSATAGFMASDNGLLITGAGIPDGTTILAVADATNAILSANATATAADVTIRIGGRTPTYTCSPTLNGVPLSDAFIDGIIAQTVLNQTARYALTGLALKTIVKQYDSGSGALSYWQVIDNTHLGDAGGWALAPEIDELELLGEFQETFGTTVQSTLYFKVIIENDVIRGNEGVPSATTPSYPVPSQIPTLDEDGNLQAIVIPRKGTAAVIEAIVLNEGEIGYETDTKIARIGDGTTPGGNPLSKQQGENCVTLGAGASTSGSFNSTVPIWPIDSYTSATKTIGFYAAFTTAQFDAGNRVFLQSLGNGTYGFATIASVNVGAQTITLTSDVSAILGSDFASGDADGQIVTQGQPPSAQMDSHAEGNNSVASGTSSHAEGYNNTANGANSHAEGRGGIASGLDSHAENAGSQARADQSHAGGYTGTAFWAGATARGGDHFSQNTSVALYGASGGLAAPLKAVGQYLPIAANGVFACTLTVMGTKTDYTDCAMFVRRFLVKRTGGTLSLVGSVQTVGSDIGSNAGAPPSGYVLSVGVDDTNKRFNFSLTGPSATNTNFAGRLDAVSIGGYPP